jgi:hypothetical protein
VIGSDPEEVRRGRAAIVAAIELDLELAGDVGLDFVAGETTAFRDGDVGWATSLGTFRLPDGTEIPTRSMSVLSRENGEWRFLQGMVSIAVPNAMIAVGSPLADAFTPDGG